jgi:hypothetical protein
MLLPCAVARAEQRVAPHVVAASPALAVGQQSAILELAGSWSGHDWGELVLNADGNGTYTDTFGTGPGQMRFDGVGDHSYKGTWRESDQRSGTMAFELSSDGQTIAGVWTPDPSSTVGGKAGGVIFWTRE